MTQSLSRYRTFLISIAVVLAFFATLSATMEARIWVSILLSGLTLAALYFLLASGLSLIFGLMDVLNFAHGSLFMLGAYAGWTFYTNPRVIFNTAPLFLALFAGLGLARWTAPLADRLPRRGLGRWVELAVVVLVALALLTLGFQAFPLDRLVAFGTTVAGRQVATAEAQEPLTQGLTRLALLFLAGLVLSVVVGVRDARRGSGGATSATTTLPRRAVGLPVGLLGLGIVLLLVRDAGETLMLKGLPTDLRFLLALVVGAAVGALVGGLIEVGLIRPLYARPIYQVLLTLGLLFVFDQGVKAVWGPAGAFMEIPAFFNTASDRCPSPDLIAWLSDHCNSIMVLGRPFPSYRLFIILVGVLLLASVALLLQRSRLGIIIRAGVQDADMVQALGINVRRVFTLVFALGAGIAGLGGVAAAPFVGVNPGLALGFQLPAFIAVVIGGMGSYAGAALGALIVGLARAFGDYLVLTGVQLPGMSQALKASPTVANASTVLIMALVLLIRPSGLFGKKD